MDAKTERHLDAKEARHLTEEARDNIFVFETIHVYSQIKEEAKKGHSSFEYAFPIEMRGEDAEKLKYELEQKGFKVEIQYALHDRIKVQW